MGERSGRPPLKVHRAGLLAKKGGQRDGPAHRTREGGGGGEVGSAPREELHCSVWEMCGARVQARVSKLAHKMETSSEGTAS